MKLKHYFVILGLLLAILCDFCSPNVFHLSFLAKEKSRVFNVTLWLLFNEQSGNSKRFNLIETYVCAVMPF